MLPARAGLINLDIGKLSFQLEFNLTVAVNLTAHYLRDGLEQRAHPSVAKDGGCVTSRGKHAFRGCNL